MTNIEQQLFDPQHMQTLSDSLLLKLYATVSQNLSSSLSSMRDPSQSLALGLEVGCRNPTAASLRALRGFWYRVRHQLTSVEGRSRLSLGRRHVFALPALQVAVRDRA